MQKSSLKPICNKFIQKISKIVNNITKLNKRRIKRQLNTKYILYICIRENKKGLREMAIAAPAGTKNNTGGDGHFSSLRRRANQQSNNNSNKTILEHTDPRMRFRNSADPYYVADNYVMSQPLSTLATSFVKESIFDIMNFVSKVIKSN